MSRIEHLAVIMDGNRRFSKRLMQEPWKGHEFGAQKVREVIEWCINHKISILTLYALSYENFNRPKKEFDYLMKLFVKEFDEVIKKIDELNEKGVKINIIGKLSLFPENVQNRMKKIMSLTRNNNAITLNFAMAYSGRAEIVDAFRRIVDKGIKAEDVNEALINDNLYMNVPPDIIIRTGGERRLSNFLTYQSVYSELFFVDTLWPEFSQQEFNDIIEEFHNRDRRFGK